MRNWKMKSVEKSIMGPNLMASTPMRETELQGEKPRSREQGF